MKTKQEYTGTLTGVSLDKNRPLKWVVCEVLTDSGEETQMALPAESTQKLLEEIGLGGRVRMYVDITLETE